MASAFSDKEHSEECLQNQKDEIGLLESMFPEPGRIQIIDAPDSEEEDSQKLYTLLLNAHVKVDGPITIDAWAPFDEEAPVANDLPLNNKPSLQRSLSGKRLHCSFKVKHLPPISLHVILPVDYPSHSCPDFTLSCLWLNPAQLEVMCRELDGLWLETDGIPVLYSWIDWLENNLFSYLALEDPIILTPHLLDDDDAVSDPRAVAQCVDLDTAIGNMLRHDAFEEASSFQQKNHLCEVCYEEKPGSESIFLMDCRHSFCLECLKEYVVMMVREGTVQQISCPHTECKAGLNPEVIRALLTDEEFERWERLLLQKTLDTLGDIQWCPRCNSLSLLDEQVDLNLAMCTECNYYFCSDCRASWHQGQPCAYQLLEIAKKKRGKNARSPAEDELEALKRRELNEITQAFIRKTSRNCPKCRVPIHKYEGCNRVVCNQCCTALCWACGAKALDYSHFDGKCSLFTSEILPMMRRQEREVPERAKEINLQIDANPEVRNFLIPCPRCHQKSLKEKRNNHIQCWACKTNFCVMCRKRIEGSLNSHYMAGKPCVQHSDDFTPTTG